MVSFFALLRSDTLHFSLREQRCSGWSKRVLEQSDSPKPFILQLLQNCMDPEAAVVAGAAEHMCCSFSCSHE
jgi:hypothetical protein